METNMSQLERIKYMEQVFKAAFDAYGRLRAATMKATDAIHGDPDTFKLLFQPSVVTRTDLTRDILGLMKTEDVEALKKGGTEANERMLQVLEKVALLPDHRKNKEADGQ